MHAHPQVRGRWLTRCVCFGVLAYAVASVITCASPEGSRARVSRGSVTGRAAAAVGDTGIFASPVLPYGVRPVIPHADAESAAVAMAYRTAPSVQDLTAPDFHTIPTERRQFCGRSYYVRPVLAMPDTLVVRSNAGNDWMMWAPTWVMPICDDEGLVRGSVDLADLPTGLHVRQGPGRRDVPELVPDSGTFPHIGEWTSEIMRQWERGIGMTPESAVKVAAALFGRSSARIADVPEAFTALTLLDPSPPLVRSPRVFGDLAICPRWRLTLDRPVTLRGRASGRVLRTRTVYVTRSQDGCHGTPVVQVPLISQPATVPFMYVQPVQPGSRAVTPPDPELHWTTLRVTEPILFEEARLER